jgi:hypothetical protein
MDTTDEQKSSGETEAEHEQEERKQSPKFVFNPFLTDMQSSGRQEETRNG